MHQQTKNTSDKLKSALVRTTGQLIRIHRGPDERLGELLDAVQSERVYSDGKTFVDLMPKRRMNVIKQEYLLSHQDPDFDLREFVGRHFYEFIPGGRRDDYVTKKEHSAREHITELWRVLERRNRVNRGSLVALPYKYIVPGGRFSEQFYWDSYFIMLGLAADGEWETIRGMMRNYSHVLRINGYIPTANRTYFLSRSQPPFFSHMVRLLADHGSYTKVLSEYLPYLLIEYRFWMKGRKKLSQYDHKAFSRVAEMPNGIVLNRYYDNKQTPRPESHREDSETAAGVPGRDPKRVFLHLRAGAESGWDFSSRWFTKLDDIRTIHTADIIPVDLNSLLYHLEMTISEAYHIKKQPILARRFKTAAERRAKAINEYCWDDNESFYVDYNFHKRKPTGRMSLAAAFPLYVGIASDEQAKAVALKIENEFLKKGGLISTLHTTGQQWDAPNGWAPLHWVAIQGLRNYGYDKLANKIKSRWIKTNLDNFNVSGKLVEKYNVVDPTQHGGGGEYQLQDGFGWTNGVLAALMDE